MDFMPKFPLKPAVAVDPVLPPPFTNQRFNYNGESILPSTRIADTTTCKQLFTNAKYNNGLDQRLIVDY